MKRYFTVPSEAAGLPSGNLPALNEGRESATGAPAKGEGVGPRNAAVTYSVEELARACGDGGLFLVGQGARARQVLTACRNAGLRVSVAYTADREEHAFPGLAHRSVCVGDTYSQQLLHNGYAVLKAAQECGAKALLLVDSPLARDSAFLGLAKARSLEPFKAIDNDSLPIAFVCCEAQARQQGESWRACPRCGLFFEGQGLALGHYVCSACGCYLRMSSLERLNDLLDADTFREYEARETPVASLEGQSTQGFFGFPVLGTTGAQSLSDPSGFEVPSTQGLSDPSGFGTTGREGLCGTPAPERSCDPLSFPGYPEKLRAVQEQTGLSEAVRCGTGRIAGMRLAICVMDAGFLMGSMGQEVGEHITCTVEAATREGLPLVICTASGGARMQEGIFSLMQMAKVSAALSRHAQAGLPYVSVLTDPTTGGVTASFATQADIILAEPGALIGFAGQRVIRDTIKRELPEGFQTAEFALRHGLIDAIVPRQELRGRLAHILALHQATSAFPRFDGGAPINHAAVEEKLNKGTYTSLSRMPPIKRVLVTKPLQVKGAAPRFSALSRLLARKPHRARPAGIAGSQEPQNLQGVPDLQDTHGVKNAYYKKGFQSPKGSHNKMSASYPKPLNSQDGSKSQSNAEGASALKNASATTQAQSGFAPKQAQSDLLAPRVPSAANPAWESVQLARNIKRPTARFYIDAMLDGFIELHGDRAFADDGAIVCGIGWIGAYPVTVVAQEKGDSLKERLARNFGCPMPEGYRKSLRIMRQAEKFGRPLVCLVDTQGAFCGTEAEERGQGNALADNLLALAGLQIPVISVIIGEGGSGGALALALADRVAMQRHAVYSILSPEGFASILWKDAARAPEAAAAMKMSAPEAYRMGIIDAVLPEGDEPAHLNPDTAAAHLHAYLIDALEELQSLPREALLEARYARFRKF
ncbi:MAG: acetyl-CoA carboxylase carboxyl transferase subunit alpha [Coriobacteriaceae bacterium]|jgi:acetyl-CoA carboxylase carboxyl transferase subunit beta|nr:acetyl-CoA carboxylase carboxyl transferase subunit alpha [Coriobacteriaceae bacterium]